MGMVGTIIKRRLFLFFMSLIVCFIVIVNYLNNRLLPIFIEYGQYQCSNIMTSILNIAVEENVNDVVAERVIIKEAGQGVTIDYNVDLLNSLAVNVVNKSKIILYEIENGVNSKEELNTSIINDGLEYEVPLSMVLGDSLIGNLGIKVPVKYNFSGNIKGQIVSSIKEYGLNGGLLEIYLDIEANVDILVPMAISEQKINVSIPVIISVIQGEIPNSYFGTHVIGGVS